MYTHVYIQYIYIYLHMYYIYIFINNVISNKYFIILSPKSIQKYFDEYNC